MVKHLLKLMSPLVSLKDLYLDPSYSLYILTVLYTNINLSNGSTLVLYADDMLLFKPISSEDDYTNLQGDVDSLKDWSASHFLTFNPSKCKYMLLSKKNKPTKNPPVLTIDNIPIERTNSHKYLGIVLTSNLTWSEHIHCICSKAKKLLGLLYRQFYKNCNPTTLLTLYVCLIRPHLEYASQVWNPHLLKDINKIENVQKFALCLF